MYLPDGLPVFTSHIFYPFSPFLSFDFPPNTLMHLSHRQGCCTGPSLRLKIGSAPLIIKKSTFAIRFIPRVSSLFIIYNLQRKSKIYLVYNTTYQIYLITFQSNNIWKSDIKIQQICLESIIL